jgi:DNA-binding response OmpR family regulator
MSESPTVLVVDDNRAIANTYTAFLSDEYTVLTAYDGREALDKLSPEVDVVLLDRRMPEVSGDAVLEEIESRQLDCRVVMLTAVDPDFDIIDMGFDEYLVKPIEREELNEVVHEMLERATYDDDFRRFLALVSKKHTLEEEKSSAELEASDEYNKIEERLSERRTQVGVDLSELENSFSDVSGTIKVSEGVEPAEDDDVPDIPGVTDDDEDEDADVTSSEST